MKKPLYAQDMSKQEPTRQSNFELLRILIMFMIIMHHLGVHSAYDGYSSIWLGQNVVKFFSIGGAVAVNVFVLITGYFLSKSKLSFPRIATIILQVFFYSMTIYIIFLACGKVKISAFGFFKSFFPIMFKEYWFITTYVAMYILSPFVNILIKNTTKRQHLILICILFFIQVLLQYFTRIDYYYEIPWFVSLYILGAYIRKYPNEILDSLPLMCVIAVLSYAAMAFLSIKYNMTRWIEDDILVFVSSVSLFCAFKNMRIKNNKFINIVASSTFGIYLIHDNNYIRSWLWNEFLRVPLAANKIGNYFILFAFVSCIVIFIVCSLIDLGRKYAIERPLFILYDKCVAKHRAKKAKKEKELKKQEQTASESQSDSN